MSVDEYKGDDGSILQLRMHTLADVKATRNKENEIKLFQLESLIA